MLKSKLESLPEGDYATSETRKVWMIPFLMNLGYDPDTASAIRVGREILLHIASWIMNLGASLF